MRKKLSLLLFALMSISAYATDGTWKATGETPTAAGSVYLDDALLKIETKNYDVTLTEDAQTFGGQTFTHSVKADWNWLYITPKKDVLVKLFIKRSADETTDSKGKYSLGSSYYIYNQTDYKNINSGSTGLSVAKESEDGWTGYCVSSVYLEKDKKYEFSCYWYGIELYGIEAAEGQPKALTAEIKDFDFNASNLPIYSDFATVAAPVAIGQVLTEGAVFTDPTTKVKLTVSKNSQWNENNYAYIKNYENKPQLYARCDTLIFEAPKGKKIKELTFKRNSWGGDNFFSSDQTELDNDGKWVGDASKLKFVVGANNNWGMYAINSISVKLGDNEKVAYAVYDEANKTLHFKYDDQKPDSMAWLCGDTGEKLPGWNIRYYKENENGVGQFVNYPEYKTVSFDASFKEARPKSCYSWFNKWSLTGFAGLANFNTSEVTNMARMFTGASSLANLNVSGFDTKNVTTMANMFNGCTALVELDVTNFNTEKVTDIGGMFSNCPKLTSIDVSSFNTANVENMYGVFAGCSALTSINVSNFNTEKVTSMREMFSGLTKLTALDLSNFNTAKVQYMGKMFSFSPALTTINLSSFNTENVVEMNDMFAGCAALKSLDLSSFNVEKVTDMSEMFMGCEALTALDLSNFDTKALNNASNMFAACGKLAKLNIDNFNTQYVSNYYNMFDGCAELTELNLMKFDSRYNPYNMGNMFNGCAKLATIKATDYFKNNNNDNMFTGCEKLPEFDENIVSGQDAIDKYCKISKVIFNNEVKAGEYVTFYTDNAVKLYGNVGKLYTITGVNTTEVAVKELKVAAKKTPMLIQNESEKDAKIMLIEPATDEKADDVKPYAGFLGTLVNKNIAGSTEGLNYYVCNGNEFVWVWQGDWINAHRCWLVVKDADAAAAPSLNIVEGEFSLTGINSVKAADQKNAEIYDLQGRKVGNAQKGMYIMNGKKVVLK